MYRKLKSITLKGSSSLLCNNLSILNAESGAVSYAVVHKTAVNISTVSEDSAVTNRQVVCKEPSATQQTVTVVIQAKWVTLQGRTVLVITSLRGIHMFESDGSSMIYWHTLGDVVSQGPPDHSNYAKGITGVDSNYICVGTQAGHVLVFVIPPMGTNIRLETTITDHKYPVSDLTSTGKQFASCDEMGNILVYEVMGPLFKNSVMIRGTDGEACSSILLWNSILVAAFGNGQIKVFNSQTGKIGAVVNAHARWINSIDIATESGQVLSVSEDTFLRVWKLHEGAAPHIEFQFGESITDLQLVGGQFTQKGGRSLCVSGYDSPEIHIFSLS
ncbi:hypothetical protein ScPMuIL_006776 [Solemya velum]